MKVLLIGASGYIGSLLLPVLLDKGHSLVCLVRDKTRFKSPGEYGTALQVIAGDMLREQSLQNIPADIDVAYYLSTTGNTDFLELEALSAHNFVQDINTTACKQIIYLNGIADQAPPTGQGRHIIEILKQSSAPLTVLRASVIIGKNSSPFQIIRALTGKLPVIFAPTWAKKKCRPIAIADVLVYLEGVMHSPGTFNHIYDICGPDTISLKEMILQYAKMHQLHRQIILVPMLLSKLSLYWLKYMASTSYLLAQNLVNSLKNDGDIVEGRIGDVVPHQCLSFSEALKIADAS